MSKRTKIIIGVYLFGCLLLYFGTVNTLTHFCDTKQLKYLPEKNLLSSLVESAVCLLRPFLAVVICGWAIIIPLALFLHGADIYRFIRNKLNNGG